MDADSDQKYYDDMNLIDFSHIEQQLNIVKLYYTKYEQILSSYFSDRQDIRVLELGAGTCALSLLISKLKFVDEIYCLDISEERMKATIPIASKVLGGDMFKLKFTKGDFGQKLNFDTGLFDLIVFDGALHHSRSIWATLSECARVMKDDGLLIAQREQYLGLLTARWKLKNLLQSSEVINGVSENAYLQNQYSYYFSANGFRTQFLPVAENSVQSLLLPLNGLIFSKWVILATKKSRIL